MIVTPETLRTLLAQEEGPTLEFKFEYRLTGPGSDRNRAEIAKDLLALANSTVRTGDAARLILGAGDELRADGTRKAKESKGLYSLRTFVDIFNARCQPPVSDLEYDEVELDGVTYGVLTMPPSTAIRCPTRDLVTPKGIWLKDSVLIRRGDQVRKASLEELAEIAARKAMAKTPRNRNRDENQEHLELAERVAAVQSRVTDLAPYLHSALDYVASDPQSSLMKSRIALEKLLLMLYGKTMRKRPSKAMIGNMLSDKAFIASLPRRIVARMNSIRDMANLGPHGEEVDPTDAGRVMKDLIDVVEYFHPVDLTSLRRQVMVRGKQWPNPITAKSPMPNGSLFTDVPLLAQGYYLLLGYGPQMQRCMYYPTLEAASAELPTYLQSPHGCYGPFAANQPLPPTAAAQTSTNAQNQRSKKEAR
jgi:hypothetical protein